MSCRMTDQLESVWNEYQQTRDRSLRDKLFSLYMPLVESRARRLQRRVPGNVTYDDLCSAGYVGLLEAVEAFTPDRRISFETFSTKRIHGAMVDWLRGLDPMSRTTRVFQKRVDQVRHQTVGSPLSDAEVASQLGISEKRFHVLERRARERTEVLFCACQKDFGTQASHEAVIDRSDPRQPDPSAEFDQQLLMERIRREVDLVGWTILKEYYFEHRTMREIGNRLHISESRVSQIHSNIARRLKHLFATSDVPAFSD